MCMVYIRLLRMRVKTEVQSVIARRRSCTDSKDPDAGSKKRVSVGFTYTPNMHAPLPLSKSPIGNSRWFSDWDVKLN